MCLCLKLGLAGAGERCCRSGHTGDPYAGSTTVPDARPLQLFQYLMKHVA